VYYGEIGGCECVFARAPIENERARKIMDSRTALELLGLQTLTYGTTKGHDLGMADNEGHEDDEGRHDGGEDGDTQGREAGDPSGESRGPGTDSSTAKDYTHEVEVVHGVPLAPSASGLARMVEAKAGKP